MLAVLGERGIPVEQRPVLEDLLRALADYDGEVRTYNALDDAASFERAARAEAAVSRAAKPARAAQDATVERLLAPQRQSTSPLFAADRKLVEAIGALSSEQDALVLAIESDVAIERARRKPTPPPPTPDDDPELAEELADWTTNGTPRVPVIDHGPPTPPDILADAPDPVPAPVNFASETQTIPVSEADPHRVPGATTATVFNTPAPTRRRPR